MLLKIKSTILLTSWTLIFHLIACPRVVNIFELNVNVIQPEQLRRACEDPEHYGNLTIRISGYAVRVNALTEDQRKELLARTLHDSI